MCKKDLFFVDKILQENLLLSKIYVTHTHTHTHILPPKYSM